MKILAFILISWCSIRSRTFSVINNEHRLLKNTLVACNHFITTSYPKSIGTRHVSGLINIFVNTFFKQDALIFKKNILGYLHAINFDDISVSRLDDTEPFYLVYFISYVTNYDKLYLIPDWDESAPEVENINEIARRVKELYGFTQNSDNFVKNVAGFVLAIKNMIDHQYKKTTFVEAFETPLLNIFNAKRGSTNKKNKLGSTIFFDCLISAMNNNNTLSARFSPFEDIPNIINENGKTLIAYNSYGNLLKRKRMIFLEDTFTTETLYFDTFDDEIIIYTYLYMLKFLSELSLNWCEWEFLNVDGEKKIVVYFLMRDMIKMTKQEDKVYQKQTKNIRETSYFLNCLDLLNARQNRNLALNNIRLERLDDTYLLESKCIAEKMFTKTKIQSLNRNLVQNGDLISKTIVNIGSSRNSLLFDSRLKKFIPIQNPMRIKKVEKKYDRDLLFCPKNYNINNMHLNIACISDNESKNFEQIIENVNLLRKNTNLGYSLNKQILYQRFRQWNNEIEKINFNIACLAKNIDPLPKLLILKNEDRIEESLFDSKNIKLAFKNNIGRLFKLTRENAKLSFKMYKKHGLKDELIIESYCLKDYSDLKTDDEIKLWVCANIIRHDVKTDDELYDETFYSIILSNCFRKLTDKESVKELFRYAKKLTIYKLLIRKLTMEACYSNFYKYCNETGLIKL